MDSFSRTSGKGFTLIEVMIALFVFLIITLAMAQTFTQSFSGYKHAKALQRDLENAQFALNLIAKELRTSTVTSFSASHVVFYDYSQSICFDYEFSSNQLFVAKKVIGTLTDPFTDCAGGFSAPVPIVKTQSPAGTVTGDFAVTPSTQTPQSVGRVAVSLEISEGPNHTAHIQTTASLRDYGYIGL